jgi:hypothetical protein
MPHSLSRRVLQKMLETIADPLSLMSRKFLSEIQLRAAQVFQKAKRCHGKAAPGNEISKLIDAVESLVNDTAYGWHPRRDITMRKCVKELKEVILRSRLPKIACAESLARIAKWGVEAPPAAVRRPTS